MADWITNDELLDAEARLKAKFDEYFRTPFHDMNPELPVEYTLTSVPGLAASMSIDPEAVRGDFYTIQSAARLLGTSEQIDTLFSTIGESRLHGWKGDAKSAFVVRFAALRNFAGHQAAHLLENIAARSALYQIATNARSSYFDLLEATISAIDVELGNQAQESTKARFSLALDLTKDIVAVDASRLLAGAIGTFIGVIKNALDLLQDGSGIEHIISAFTSKAEDLHEQLQNELEVLRNRLTDMYSTALSDTSKSELARPLPACTDVESPDFRYSSFWYPTREPDDFEPRVQTERKEMQAEEEQRETDIHRRLRGAR